MSTQESESSSELSLVRIKKASFLSKNQKAILTILKILVGLALLVLSVQDIQVKNLISGIQSAKLFWLVLAIIFIFFGLALKLWRWAILVRNYQIKVRPARLFSAYFVGQATNIILPLRGGELVRLGYFADNKSLLPQAASTIILEKYLDLLALTICVLLVSLNMSLENILNLRGWLLPLSAILTVILLSAILLGPALWKRLRDRKLLPQRLADGLDQWVLASLWLRNPAQLFPGVLLTILIWGVMWFTNILLFNSLGLPLNATAGGAVLVLVYIGLFPALMPGNIGPFYFFGRLALSPFGIIHDQAMVFTVILHAIVTLPPLLGGAIGLFIRSDKAIRV